MIWDVHPVSRIRIFFPSRIPDPGVKKAPDPGSGSATLGSTVELTTSAQHNVNAIGSSSSLFDPQPEKNRFPTLKGQLRNSASNLYRPGLDLHSSEKTMLKIFT
jgi:hypothetical protein